MWCIDRLLLTTDTNFIPTGFGPAATALTSITTTLTRTIVYTYDDLYRLTHADYSTGEFFDYTYDPAGNRLSQTSLAGTNVYTYDAANRLTQVDGQSYTWDNNGNLLSDGQRTFTYDTANRLSGVTGDITATYEYNGDGDRYAQTVGGVTTDYVLDPMGLAQVLIESSSGQSHFYLPGLAQYDGSNWQYFATDRLGSVRQQVDPTGVVLSSQTFDPFGNVLEQSGAGQSIFGYTREQTDPAGLVYLRARYYNPPIGRFLTADSIILDPFRSQSRNRYTYGENNPIRNVDPSGHCIVQWSGEVRMGQAPYGTSGVCPHTETNGIESAYNVTEVTETPGFGDDPTRGPAIAGLFILFGAPELALVPKLIARLVSACSAVCADGDCTNELKAAYNVGNKTIEATTGLGKIASQLQSKASITFDHQSNNRIIGICSRRPLSYV